jgi:hypothetical protein
MKNDTKKFDVHAYVETKYGQQVVDDYEEAFGLNGLDNLWSCENEQEVDELLKDF